MIKLEQRRDLGWNQGLWQHFFGKIGIRRLQIFTKRLRSRRISGTFSPSLVHISGFRRDIRFELHDWLPDIFIFIFIAICIIIEHSTGTSVDKQTLIQWITIHFLPFIDLQHSDAVRLYIPLSPITNFSFSGPQSEPEDNSDTASAFHIVPYNINNSEMRFKSRISLVQLRFFLILGYFYTAAIFELFENNFRSIWWGPLTSAILNLLMQYFQSATPSYSHSCPINKIHHVNVWSLMHGPSKYHPWFKVSSVCIAD